MSDQTDAPDDHADEANEPNVWIRTSDGERVLVTGVDYSLAGDVRVTTDQNDLPDPATYDLSGDDNTDYFAGVGGPDYDSDDLTGIQWTGPEDTRTASLEPAPGDETLGVEGVNSGSLGEFSGSLSYTIADQGLASDDDVSLPLGAQEQIDLIHDGGALTATRDFVTRLANKPSSPATPVLGRWITPGRLSLGAANEPLSNADMVEALHDGRLRIVDDSVLVAQANGDDETDRLAARAQSGPAWTAWASEPLALADLRRLAKRGDVIDVLVPFGQIDRPDATSKVRVFLLVTTGAVHVVSLHDTADTPGWKRDAMGRDETAGPLPVDIDSQIDSGHFSGDWPADFTQADGFAQTMASLHDSQGPFIPLGYLVSSYTSPTPVDHYEFVTDWGDAVSLSNGGDKRHGSGDDEESLGDLFSDGGRVQNGGKVTGAPDIQTAHSALSDLNGAIQDAQKKLARDVADAIQTNAKNQTPERR